MTAGDGSGARVFVDELSPAVRARLAEWQEEIERRAHGSLERVASALRERVEPGVRVETWRAAEGRGLETLVIDTGSEIASPLLDLYSEVDLGAELRELALGILEIAGERASSLAPEGEPEEDVLVIEYAFARSIADDVLPHALRTAVTDHARILLTHKARVATEMTRWMYALLRAEEAARRVVAAEAAETETAPGATGVVPAPEAATGEPGEEGPSPEEAPAPEEVLRQGLEARVQSLTDATTALRNLLAREAAGAIGEAVEGAIRGRLEEFEPQRRKWRAAAREMTSGAGTAEATASRAPWLDRLELPDRFAAETGRVRLCSELLTFETFARGFTRERLLAAADDDLRGAADELGAAVDAIRRLEAEAVERFDDAAEGGSPPDVYGLLRRGRAAIGAARRQVARRIEARGAQSGTVQGLSELMARIGDLPRDLRVAPLLDADGRARLSGEGQQLDLRGWAAEVFDARALDRLSGAGAPYMDALRAAEAAIPRARDVMEYNLGAAALPGELPAEGAVDLQRELVVGGLSRTADRLAEVVDALEETRREGPDAPEALVRHALRRLRDRAEAEGGVGGHARDVIGVVRASGLRRAGRTGRAARRVLRRVRAYIRLAVQRLTRTWRRARSAVGVQPADRRRADETARDLASIDTGARGLPFVYRRLFSYGPLEDPGLLIGRTRETELLDSHLDAWESEASTGVLLVGTSGVGVTSLLLTTRERWYERVDWRSVSLTERIEDEESWARRLGEALDLEPAPRSLAEVEAGILARPKSDLPLVCAIENLEHVYFRGVIARGLIAPTLKLMSATDTVVLWLASIPASAWDVIRATDPGLSGLLRVIQVQALGRRDMEGAILTRHRRSGIPLLYTESDDLPLGVRRALSREADPAERTRIVRQAFFDRLYELSEGFVALGLLYWLRSIDPESTAEAMTIRWPRSIDFAAWEDLDVDAGFALRAFLEHGSLSIPEYARLFGVSETSAFAMFERLGGLLILEAVGDVRQIGSQLAFHRVDAHRRYRIRPVLVRPVERLLISRRLLY